MMKPLGLGYQKIDICLIFCMLYYLKNVELTECITYGHSCYKPRTGMRKSLVAYKKFRYFSITLRLQRLFMSPKTVEHMIWHQSHDAMDWVMVHPSDSEAWKHFNNVHHHFFSWIKERAYVFDCVQTNSTHLGHLLLLILVGWLYSQFTTCHRECVWDWSSCFYLRSYPILTVWVVI